MSHLNHATIALSARFRSHWMLALAALLALAATAALVIALAVSDNPSASSASGQREAAVPARVPVTAPDESKTAAAIGAGREVPVTSVRPDESAVAAAISGRGGE